MGPIGVSIVNNTGIGAAANTKLMGALSGRSPIDYFFNRSVLVAEVNDIGVELMQQHARITTAVGTPTPVDIAAYHWEVFANHGLHPSAFGGTPYFGARWEARLTAGIWLTCH